VEQYKAMVGQVVEYPVAELVVADPAYANEVVV